VTRKSILAALLLASVGVIAVLLMPPLRGELPLSNPRVARGHLRNLIGAQEQFRLKGYSADGSHTYWRGDIAQLHSLKIQGRPIGLIDPSLAAADDRPGVGPGASDARFPLDGYLYRAILIQGETQPDPQHFGLCAFPAAYPKSGRQTLVATDSGIVYARDLGRGGGVDVCPRDPAREGWRIVEGP
jgi:hypothetical protein